LFKDKIVYVLEGAKEGDKGIKRKWVVKEVK
jgi:hypothetical protein